MVFPVLTPLAVDPGRPFPHISNLSLNLAVVVEDDQGDERFARLKVPAALPRLVTVPEPAAGPPAGESSNEVWFVMLEEVIAANLGQLFPGMQVKESYAFRITRNAELVIQELEAEDLLELIERGVHQRRFASVTRLTVERAMPERIRSLLLENLEVGQEDMYATDSPLAISGLTGLQDLDRPDLKDAPFVPGVPAGPQDLDEEDLFAAIRRRDILLHHPFDSFLPVIDFLTAASNDPAVLAIKMTLYRVGRNAPVVAALLNAARNGKQVAVLVELKARFDEESNIEWARALEAEGVHVVYGLLGLKTHSKIALVVRQESDGLRRYVHLATGQLQRRHRPACTRTSGCSPARRSSAPTRPISSTSSPATRRRTTTGASWSPLGTCARGWKSSSSVRSTTPGAARSARHLQDERACGPEHDPAAVQGVAGGCSRGPAGARHMLPPPGDPRRERQHPRHQHHRAGSSSTAASTTSGNGGEEEVYLGSADLMPRNLNRRVEVLFPVLDPRLLRTLRDVVLAIYLDDNVRARHMQPDGTYVRAVPGPGEEPVDSQAWLLAAEAR